MFFFFIWHVWIDEFSTQKQNFVYFKNCYFLYYSLKRDAHLRIPKLDEYAVWIILQHSAKIQIIIAVINQNFYLFLFRNKFFLRFQKNIRQNINNIEYSLFISTYGRYCPYKYVFIILCFFFLYSRHRSMPVGAACVRRKGIRKFF